MDSTPHVILLKLVVMIAIEMIVMEMMRMTLTHHCQTLEDKGLGSNEQMGVWVDEPHQHVGSSFS